MSDQSSFIKEAFYLIKNSFEEFKNINIDLKIVDFNDFPKKFKLAAIFHSFEPEEMFEIVSLNNLEVFRDEEPSLYLDLVKENKMFLESNGIPINEYSLMLGVILHEFGHAFHEIYWQSFADWEDYVDLSDINMSYTLTVKRYMRNNTVDYNTFNRRYLFAEIFAEKFKFEHFLRFWKLLGKTTLDEFRSIQSIASLICHFNIDSNMFDNEGREYLNTIGIADEDIRLIYKLNTTVGRDLKPLIEFI